MTEHPKVTDQTARPHGGARPLRWSAVVVSRGLKAGVMDSTPHPRSTHTGLAAAVCAILGASLLAVGAVLMKPVESSGISPRIDGANGSIDPYQESNMKTLHAFRTAGALGVLAVTQIALVSGASAQSTAVQWKVADGGNGHWYEVLLNQESWIAAKDRCEIADGHLATITTQAENDFAAKILTRSGLIAAWLGGQQQPNSCEPACGWMWITGETFAFETWRPGEPNNFSNEGLNENALVLQGQAWNDYPATLNAASLGSICEWSADCNNDNIVDYGQIITGQLADSNTNGIPDICEQPQCQDADITNNHIVDGADLGSLLAFWGPVNPVLPQADINRDGVVNGADIGILLANWGPCGT